MVGVAEKREITLLTLPSTRRCKVATDTNIQKFQRTIEIYSET